MDVNINPIVVRNAHEVDASHKTVFFGSEKAFQSLTVRLFHSFKTELQTKLGNSRFH